MRSIQVIHCYGTYALVMVTLATDNEGLTIRGAGNPVNTYHVAPACTLDNQNIALIRCLNIMLSAVSNAVL